MLRVMRAGGVSAMCATDAGHGPEALGNLRASALMAQEGAAEDIANMIASTIHVIVHLGRGHATVRRRVTAVCEVAARRPRAR